MQMYKSIDKTMISKYIAMSLICLYLKNNGLKLKRYYDQFMYLDDQKIHLQFDQ